MQWEILRKNRMYNVTNEEVIEIEYVKKGIREIV